MMGCPEDLTHRQLAVIHLSPTAIARLTFAPLPCWLEVTGTDVPDDAQVRMVSYAPERDMFIVLLESKAFRCVPVGEILPVLRGPTYTTHTTKPGGLV